MWYPGNQRYFNQMLSPAITFALGACVGEMFEYHPGLHQSRYDDVFTESLDVRPRLQVHATTNPRFTKTVVKTG
jgi:hypothetical protein